MHTCDGFVKQELEACEGGMEEWQETSLWGEMAVDN